jgi:hypothetical protein
MREITVDYQTWKLVAGVMPMFYMGNVDDGFRLFASSDVAFIESEVSGADAQDFNTNHRPSATIVGSRDDAYVRGLIAAKAPLVTPRDGDGTGKVIQELRSDSRLIVTSHNLCDRTTWYQDSERVIDEVLVGEGDGKTFGSGMAGWIDLTHGKVSDEDDVAAAYIPIVKVDGVIHTENTPFSDDLDGSFAVDYGLGKVVFNEAVPVGWVVAASFPKARSSVFTIAPSAGRILRMVETECQLSTDLVMEDDLWYGVYVGSTCVKAKRYKKISDFMNDATGAYPVIPAMGGAKRGTAEAVVFPWPLKSRTDLFHKAGMSLKIRMARDIQCGGSFATVSFYFLSISE